MRFVTIRVRLGHGLARLASAPLATLDLQPAATVADACERLAREQPALAPALPGVLAVVGGAQVPRTHPLTAGDELALLMPLSGG